MRPVATHTRGNPRSARVLTLPTRRPSNRRRPASASGNGPSTPAKSHDTARPILLNLNGIGRIEPTQDPRDDCESSGGVTDREGVDMAQDSERRKRTPNIGACAVDGCGHPMRKRAWCASHYAQQQKSGKPPEPFKYKWGQAEPRPFIPKPRRVRATCGIDGCQTPAHGYGLCAKHYTRQRRYGDANFVQRVWRELQPCLVCGSESRSIKSRFLCSKRCEQLFYTYNGNVPTERECVQCGA